MTSADDGRTKRRGYQMALSFHIDTPACTMEEFARRSGMPVGTVHDKVHKGELPTLRLALTPGKRERVLVNMVKLLQMADAAEFDHPAMNEG